MTAEEFLKEYNRVCSQMTGEFERLQKVLADIPESEQAEMEKLVGKTPIGCLFLSTSPIGESVRDKHHMALLTFPQVQDVETALSPNAPFLVRLFAGMEPDKALTVVEAVMVSVIWGLKADPIGIAARIAMRILENAHAVARVRAKEMEGMIRRHLEAQAAKKAQEAEPKPSEEKKE